MTLIRVFTALFALLSSTVLAVTPIKVEGSQFINAATKKRFQIIGVDYQPGGASAYNEENKSDPLSDGDICLRDAALLQRLGVNTIRIYNLNPGLNHDLCVSIFNAAGIYLILDVNSPIAHESLNRVEPWTTYHKGYMERVFGVIEAFKDYPNVLAFFGGNEVINEDAVKQVPAYIRAVQRDMKQYIANHSPRPIPVGYSAADIRDILADTWAYFSCNIEDDPDSISDFFGLNSYSWCGDATFESAGYNTLVDQFKDTTLPVFFSEYGCNEVQPRIFTEVAALYGKQMVSAMGGGLIYEYSQEDNDYGIVELHENNTATTMIDYDNLMEQYSKIDIALLESVDQAGATKKPVKCTPDLIKDDKFFENDFKIPPPTEGIPDMIKNGISSPNKGKLVEVKETNVKFDVFNKDGRKLEGLQIKILEDFQSNLPGENTSGAPGEPDFGSEDKEDAATSLSRSNVLSLLAIGAGATLLML
ncbi:hypothetical protein AJ79_03019 [Helicocarpus griseus UAMH5409]|uniref:1,3-beta-glucanosyltransferase n=1 Tax=Helicocarpus griseus UAMH5409 TaxID=1447875 RepID=A0A2B7XZ88_9EURO|nr:hypothetical protein AJ79_03019 [Helicocarpus griseus UAMH5409]